MGKKSMEHFLPLKLARGLFVIFFISSTFKDLQIERASAIELIDRVPSWKAYAMEKFYASDHPPREECLGWLRESDALILIIGGCYGSIDEQSGLSMTELEYDTAVQLHIPVFTFIKSEEETWVSTEQVIARKTKHEAFIHKIEKTWRPFRTVDELKTEIILAIEQHRRQHGLSPARLKTFLSPDEFFRPFLDKEKGISHSYPLIGRENYLEAICNFISSPKRVALLYGRGGIGKSKILYEALRVVQSSPEPLKCLVVAEGIPFSKDAVKELPEDDVLIVVEDAHRKTSEIKQLISLVQEYPGRIKLLLSLRPYGSNLLKSELSNAGVEPSETIQFEEVIELPMNEVRRLAQEVLATEDKLLIDQLADLSFDCPLITVVGGQLIKEGDIEVYSLITAQEFQDAVLPRFRDVMIGEIEFDVDAAIVRKILQLISAIAPLRPDNREVLGVLGAFCGIEMYEVSILLSDLEEKGLLLRRGSIVRLTPDVLSDFILGEAALTAKGDSTGFIERIFEVFSKISLRNLLRNASELDWRTERGEGNLLANIWVQIKEEYMSAKNSSRIEFLNTLEEIAYYQPSHALEIVQMTLENPLDDEEAQGIWVSRKITNDDVRRSLPPVLENAAIANLSTLERAADLLWLIGHDDDRPLNQYPDHGIRILQDLASFKRWKPIDAYEVILTLVRKWVQEDDAFTFIYSPLDILEKLLAREATETNGNRTTITITSLLVPAEYMRPVREPALELLNQFGQGQNPEVALRILRYLLHLLGSPIGRGPDVTLEELKNWAEENLKIFKIVEQMLSQRDDVILCSEATYELRRRLYFERNKTIEDEIIRLLEVIPESLESRIIRYLLHGVWQTIDYSSDVDTNSELANNELEEISSEFSGNVDNPQDSIMILESIMQSLTDHGEKCRDASIISALAKASPMQASSVCQLILGDSHSKLSEYIGHFLEPARTHDEDEYHSLIADIIESGERSMLLSLAQLLASVIDLDVVEVQAVKTLSRHADKRVSGTAIWAFTKFPPELAISTLEFLSTLAIDETGDNADYLDEIYLAIDVICEKQNMVIPEHIITTLLGNLTGIIELESNYHICAFVESVFAENPITVVHFFMARIARDAAMHGQEIHLYEPIPLSFLRKPMHASNESEHYEALCMVRNSMLEADPEHRFHLNRLFRAVSSNHNTTALRVIGDWINTGDSDQLIAAAELLQYAQADFVLEHEDLVTQMLDSARLFGRNIEEVILTILTDVAVRRAGSTLIGEPNPEYIKLGRLALEAASRYPASSTAHSFYTQLNQAAMDMIEHDFRRWEEDDFQ